MRGIVLRISPGRPAAYGVGFRVAKLGGEPHEVERWPDGRCFCDCESFRFRRTCRHADAVQIFTEPEA